MTTLTDPGYNLPSTPAGMMSPVPISVIGTTGTLVFAAILNAPFYKTEREEICRSQLSCSLQALSKISKWTTCYQRRQATKFYCKRKPKDKHTKSDR